MILLIDLCYKIDSLSSFEFIKPVAKIVGKCEIRHFSQDINLKGYRKAIICGTSLMDNGYLDEVKDLSWLKESKIPILGICAGMHLIAKAFGGNPERMDSPNIGMIDVLVNRKNNLANGRFQAYSLHSLRVKENDSYAVLASSKNSIEMIKVKRKLIFGVQFHPEVRNPEIIENFLRL